MTHRIAIIPALLAGLVGCVSAETETTTTGGADYESVTRPAAPTSSATTSVTTTAPPVDAGQPAEEDAGAPPPPPPPPEDPTAAYWPPMGCTFDLVFGASACDGHVPPAGVYFPVVCTNGYSTAGCFVIGHDGAAAVPYFCDGTVRCCVASPK
jgi:hypothetical protein